MLSRNEIEQTLVEWARAWSEHDLDGVMALFHDDVLFESWTGAKVRGKASLWRAWAPWFHDHGGFWFSMDEILVDEKAQKALLRWWLEWPSRERGHEGKPERRQGIDILYFRDGKVAQKLTFSKTSVEIGGQKVQLSAAGETKPVSPGAWAFGSTCSASRETGQALRSLERQ